MGSMPAPSTEKREASLSPDHLSEYSRKLVTLSFICCTFIIREQQGNSCCGHLWVFVVLNNRQPRARCGGTRP